MQSGAQLQGSGDIFFSDQYEDSASCQWTITCRTGHPQVHFNNFNTEHNFDFVSVYDGSSTSSSRLAHLSGAMSDLAHTDYSGSSRAMVLQFTSDGSVQGTGFDATYSCAASSSSSSSSACTTIRCVPQSPPIPQVPSGVAKALILTAILLRSMHSNQTWCYPVRQYRQRARERLLLSECYGRPNV